MCTTPHQKIEEQKQYDYLNRYRKNFDKIWHTFKIQKVSMEGIYVNIIKAIDGKPTIHIILNGGKLDFL